MTAPSWDPLLPRLDDLAARRQHVTAQGWKAEVEGIELTLTFLRSKRSQVHLSRQLPPGTWALCPSRPSHNRVISSADTSRAIGEIYAIHPGRLQKRDAGRAVLWRAIVFWWPIHQRSTPSSADSAVQH